MLKNVDLQGIRQQSVEADRDNTVHKKCLDLKAEKGNLNLQQTALLDHFTVSNETAEDM